MEKDSSNHSDFALEEAMTILEEAQTKVMNRDDLDWAATSAAMLAYAAAEKGNRPFAEKCHRTAINAYNQAYTLEKFKSDNESEYLVSPDSLQEYVRLAETLYRGPKDLYAHSRLHQLGRELSTLGPLDSNLAIMGIIALAETERRLGSHSLTRRKAHARRAAMLGGLCMVAGQSEGLPLMLVENYQRPRLVKEWIHDIRQSSIISEQKSS